MADQTIGEYNTSRPDIILKEYGRNVQKLVEYIRSIPDKEKRTELAFTLIELMKQLTPSVKEATPENPQRMWDDLYVIADFTLDLNSPFPIPDRETLFKKPAHIGYPQSNIRFKHYGKNIERLIKEAVKLENEQERNDAVIYLGKLMKTFYGNWNKETLDDSVIVNDIRTMSQGKLSLDLEQSSRRQLIRAALQRRESASLGQEQSADRERGQGQHRSGGGHRNNKNRFKNKNRNSNNNNRRRDQ
jgi:hypothetical protein